MEIVFAFYVSGAEIGNVFHSEGDFLLTLLRNVLRVVPDSPCWNKFVTERQGNNSNLCASPMTRGGKKN